MKVNSINFSNYRNHVSFGEAIRDGYNGNAKRPFVQDVRVSPGKEKAKINLYVYSPSKDEYVEYETIERDIDYSKL